MFVEYIFPPNGKEAIYKLKINNCLNETAIKLLDKQSLYLAIILLAGSFVFYNYRIFFALFFLLTPLVIIFEIYNQYKLRLCPYLFGKKTKIEIGWLHIHLGGVYKATGRLVENNETVILGIESHRRVPLKYNRGDIIDAYVYKDGSKYYGMPAHPEYKKRYCLNKNL